MPKDLIELSDEISKKYGNSPALLFKPGFKYISWSYKTLSRLFPRQPRQNANQSVCL